MPSKNIVKYDILEGDTIFAVTENRKDNFFAGCDIKASFIFPILNVKNPKNNRHEIYFEIIEIITNSKILLLEKEIYYKDFDTSDWGQ